MIRIPTYKEHIRGKKILDRYLYLVAFVLPFSPQEVLGDDILEVDGKTYTADNFILESGKRPRRRIDTSQKTAYTQLLDSYFINRAITEEEKFEEDRKMAAILIYKDLALFEYLYENRTDPKTCKIAPTIKCHKLRNILLMQMNTVQSTGLEWEPNGADDLLKHVFRYEAFSKNTQAFRLLEDMDINVCPYCNRIYTNTVLQGKKGLSRSQFDHCLPKKKYPQFALSLLNLIPSCGICNQAKSDRMEKVMYPYTDEFGTDIMFQTSIKTGISYLLGDRDAKDQFEVILEQVNPHIDVDLLKRINASVSIFHLAELYNKHKDYILFLFRKNYMFSDDYIETLEERFRELFGDDEDIHSLLYMIDFEKEEWGRRPLSKLTHDIDMELRIPSDGIKSKKHSILGETE